MLLGCIGDDFTGSSDLANTLSKQGMRTVQYTGVPQVDASAGVEAGVVALKSRSIAPEDAVHQSLEALRWLRDQGCKQFFFKYCSTFDSTSKGNIGPVTDALAEALNADKVIVCPAFPGTGRSVCQGHLFVNDVLLNESGMENHPLTPMTDPDLRRWLKPQSRFEIGHVPVTDVLKGAKAIEAALNKEHAHNKRLIVVDAIRDEDLIEIGKAAEHLPFLTGGSGVALGLPVNFANQGLVSGSGNKWTKEPGKTVILCGSCSNTTRTQIAVHQKNNPSFEINAISVIEKTLTPDDLIAWFQKAEGTPLAYSSAGPEVVRVVQETYGRGKAAATIESFFAETARRLVAAGITSIIAAGGETSGAVVEGLEIDTLEIGPEIAAGVPALRAGPDLVIALKSGNFGNSDFFEIAASILSGASE